MEAPPGCVDANLFIISNVYSKIPPPKNNMLTKVGNENEKLSSHCDA